MNKLPELAYVLNKTDNKIIIVKRGELGYYEAKDTKGASIDELNSSIGVTKQQARAMYMGSMFGWHVDGANPDIYDSEGRYVSSK